MKNIVYTLFFGLFAQYTQAQIILDETDGYIIMPNRDTVYGKLRFGTPAQRSVKIVFVENGEHIKYQPFQIMGYYLGKYNEFYEAKIYDFNASADFGYSVFMKCTRKGAVSLYEYWNTDKERGFTQTILQRSNEKMVEIQFWNFKKQMQEYFKDFPQLSAKIERGAFGRKDLERIVEEYNLWRQRGW